MSKTIHLYREDARYKDLHAPPTRAKGLRNFTGSFARTTTQNSQAKHLKLCMPMRSRFPIPDTNNPTGLGSAIKLPHKENMMERLEDFVDFSDDELEDTGECLWQLQLNFDENNLAKPSPEFSELYNSRGVHVNPEDEKDIVDGKKLLNDAGFRFVKERGDWMVERGADIEVGGVFVPEWLSEKLYRACYGEPEKRNQNSLDI